MDEPQDTQASQGAGGRRRGGRGRREHGGLAQRPWGQRRTVEPPMRAISNDELLAIHDASLTILEEIGMDFLNEEARQILAAAGASVEPGGPRVRFDRGLVTEAVATAPSEFTMHARNPARNLKIGGGWVVNGAVGSPPNVSDRDRGRRPGNREDFRNLLRLTQFFNVVHSNGGYPAEPIDIHPSVRHLDALADVVTLTDKVPHAYSLGAERNRDAIEMVRIARGIDDETLDREPSLFTVINASSPLRYDTPMLQGIIEMARRGQGVIVTPFTLAGAMAPVTVAGALAQQNAEALAGIAFAQIVRPGAPVMYGGFTSNVDMKSGAPAFGTPEYMKAVIVGGQLSRLYGLPYRTSNVCAANTVDAQAAYESVFSLWAVTMAGGNLVKHAAGWLEGGLTASFEKFVLDVDLLQMIDAFVEPLVVDEASLALDAVREVGPGGHFFGAAHTRERYETAFYTPIVSDWRNFEAWSEAGSPDAGAKANAVWKQALAEYEEPPLDPAIREELEAFVAKRKEEGGAPTDF